MAGDKGKKKAEEGITQTGERIYETGRLTPSEQSQYDRSFELGKVLEDLQKYLAGYGEKPSGYVNPEEAYLRQTGPLGQAYYQTALEGVRDPYAAYESTLHPALQLAEDYINRQAQSRGLLRSGIPIEQMGRAGVELAIKEAEGRMQARERELARGGTMAQYTQEQQGRNISDLSNLYRFQQGAGQSAMGRQLQGATTAGQYQVAPYSAQLGNYYGQQAAMQALPGQFLSAAGTVGASALAPQTKLYPYEMIGSQMGVRKY